MVVGRGDGTTPREWDKSRPATVAEIRCIVFILDKHTLDGRKVCRSSGIGKVFDIIELLTTHEKF